MSTGLTANCCTPQKLAINSSTGYLTISDGNSVYLGTVLKNLGVKTPVINFVINGYIITLTYTDVNGTVQNKTVDLSSLAPGGNITVTDTTSIDLTYASANLSGAVKISAQSNNGISINSDGLYASSLTQVPLTVNDSSTIDLTASGSSNMTLTAAVKISSNSGNKIQVVSDGLLVTDMKTYITQGSFIIITGSGTPGDPYNISATPGSQIPLSVTDSNSIDLTSSGSSGMNLTASVKVSSLSANAIIVNSDGLYVPQSSVTPYTDAQARAAISATAPILYNSTTGVISEPQATSGSSGYLANSDWTTFNNKISGGASIGSTSSVPVFAGQNITTLNFNGLRAGTNVNLNQVGNDIVISASGSGGGGSSTSVIDFIIGDGGPLTPTANSSTFNPSSQPLLGRTVLGFWIEGMKTAPVVRGAGVVYYSFDTSTGIITLTNAVFSTDTYYSILYK